MIGEILMISILIVPLLGIAFLIFIYTRKKKLTPEKIAFYEKKIYALRSSESRHRIMQYDSILNHILKDLGISGGLGEQLKKKPKILENDLEVIWKLHKLRNKIAHELGNMDERMLLGEAGKYERKLRSILEELK